MLKDKLSSLLRRSMNPIAPGTPMTQGELTQIDRALHALNAPAPSAALHDRVSAIAPEAPSWAYRASPAGLRPRLARAWPLATATCAGLAVGLVLPSPFASPPVAPVAEVSSGGELPLSTPEESDADAQALALLEQEFYGLEPVESDDAEASTDAAPPLI